MLVGQPTNQGGADAREAGIAGKVHQTGFTNVIEMDAWEEAALGPVAVTAPGKHAVPEITYILLAFGLIVYFGGDTWLIPPLSELASRFPTIDLAVLAVNGLRIRPMLNRQVVMVDRHSNRRRNSHCPAASTRTI